MEEHSKSVGLFAADTEDDRLYDEIAEVEARILALPIHSDAGAKVKAAMAMRYMGAFSEDETIDAHDWAVRAAAQVAAYTLRKGKPK